MSIETIVQQCRDLLDELPAAALAKARAKHGDIGGFAVFPVYAPVEIIHAAGMLPVGLFGAGDQIEISHADSRFQSFICSIAKSTLELFLRGDMVDFEGAVFSSICDVARNLCSIVKRNSPDLFVEYLHLPQNVANPTSAAFTRSEFKRFRDNLAQHLGRPITDEAIRHSLDLYNETRSIIRKLHEHRNQRPGSITTAELCTVVQATTRMMPEDSVELLSPLVDLVAARSVTERDCVPVVVEGAFCEQPPLGLIDVIEAAGCQIKADDMIVGWRLFEADVVANGSPVDALADAYLSKTVYTSVRYDQDRPRTQGLVDRMKSVGADAVLFAPAKFCEPALLDYVLFRRRLEADNVPHLKLEFEEKMWTFDSARTEVETFAESMLFD